MKTRNDRLEHRIAARTRELEIAREELIATNMDVEATVTRRNVRLRDSIEAKQRFVYAASDDVRAPLVNIVGLTREPLQSLKPLEASIDEQASISVCRKKSRRHQGGHPRVPRVHPRIDDTHGPPDQRDSEARSGESPHTDSRSAAARRDR